MAGSRLFLHRDIHDRFLEALVERIKSVRIGDIFDEETQMGPLVSQEQLERVLNYIDVGKQEGAKLLVGGARVENDGLGDGYYVEPTVFTGVDNEMRIAQEETFGPVLSVIVWDDEEEMIRQANDSPFGLYAGIWTQDIDKALTTARRLEAGGVIINDWYAEVPQAPHGGHKQSGINREEGLETIANYTQVKHVSVNLDGRLTGAEGMRALRSVGRPRLFETPRALSQARLFALDALGEGGWLKAMRLEGPPRAPRRSLGLQQTLFPYREALG